MSGVDDTLGETPVVRPRLRAHLGSPLYRNAYYLLFGAGAGSLLGVLFWALAARHYPAASVGLNSVLISAMILVSGVCQLGLSAVLFRYLPGAGGSARALIVRSYALTSVLSALVGAGAALSSGLWAPGAGFLHSSAWWVLGFSVATAAWTIFTLQDAVLTGFRQARWVPIETVLFSAMKIALLGAFVGVSRRAGIFLAWTIPVLISLVPINLLIFRVLLPRHMQCGFEVPRDRRVVLRLAAGNYFGWLFLIVSTTVMPIILAAEVGAKAAAYFYIPWTISIGLQLVALNMTTSLTVEAAHDESKLHDYCRSVTRQTMRLLVPIVALLVAAAPYVLLAFGAAYASEGATCLRLLALATIPNVFVALGVSVARIRHDGRLALVIPGAACVLSVGLSVASVPHFGINGVGWSMLLGQSAVAVWLLAGPLRTVFFRHRS